MPQPASVKLIAIHAFSTQKRHVSESFKHLIMHRTIGLTSCVGLSDNGLSD